MIRLLCFFLIFPPLASQAQFTYFLDQSISVQDLAGQSMAHPWAGGLNAAAFNTMDLNGDGADDLVLFDRMAGKVITFLNADNKYVPAPEFEEFFPLDVANWLLLRDYNCDGKKDIFTGDVLGIKVFKNATLDGADLQWEQHFFSTGFSGPKSGVLLTRGSNDKVNLQLQFDDLPAITDVDGDGDLDILNIQYAGHTVEYHQNLSVENSQPCDSMDFKRVTRSWGNFRECDCGVFAFNGESCPPNSGGRIKHAGGKGLLVLDINGDQQQDLLFSEAECSQLFALPNAGTTSNPVMNSFSAFPAANPVNFVIFPAAFYEDVDFDGKKDLISAPNIFTKEFINTNLQQSTWLYKNTGTASTPAFSFVERNFLQGQMIDVGDNSVPAFTDYDSDGDFDLFISRSSSDDYVSTVYLYENVGSAESPAFKLLTDDYFGFSTTTFYNLKIQFADMNSDNTQDLIFTASNFDNSGTSLYYLGNKSQTGLDFTGAPLQRLDFSFTSSENVYVTDVNEDGLPDLLVGRSEGNLEYWKNSGIEGSPLFALEDEHYLGFDGSVLRLNITCVAADLDGDGQKDLAVGDQTGRLGVISDFRNSTADVSQLESDIIFNAAQEIYVAKNLGGRIWPAVVNLYNSNKPTLVVGNILGGLHILKHDEGESLPEEPELNIYPNPVGKNEVLNVKADRQGILQVFSVLGQEVSTPLVVGGNQVHLYNLPHLASGLYVLKFTANKKSSTQRLIIK